MLDYKLQIRAPNESFTGLSLISRTKNLKNIRQYLLYFA